MQPKRITERVQSMLSSSQGRQILFAMTGAEGLPGGIACLNRNILRSIDALAEDRERELRVLSLHETKDECPDYLGEQAGFTGFNGNKQRFAIHLFVEALRADLVVFDHVALSVPVWPLSKSGVLKSVIVAHGPEAWGHVRRRSIACYRACSKVLTNSEFTLRKMRERFDGFDGVACPLGLNPDFMLNDSIPEPLEESVELEAVDGKRRSLGERTFLLVGRIDPRQRGKGHKELIEALPEVRRVYRDAQLVFPGPGDGRKMLAELACELDVDDAVFLPGFVSKALLEKLYCTSFAFTMPSRQDGFGLAYLEAMNYGLACVGSRGDGGECVIDDGQTGILLPEESDSGEVAQCLVKLCKSPEKVEEMGRAGFRKLHQQFTARAFQMRFRRHIESLLGS